MAHRRKSGDPVKIAEAIFKTAMRRSSSRTKGGGVLRPLLGIVLLAILALVLVSREESDVPGSYRVERCVDGDTIILVDRDERLRVRFIGVDTPETKKPNWPVERFGREASDFTRNAVEQAGNVVRIEYDGPKTDRYGRVLAHVYTGEKLLGEELVRAGLAVADLKYPYSQAMKNRFRAAEYEAQKAGRGIWSPEAP